MLFWMTKKRGYSASLQTHNVEGLVEGVLGAG